MGNRFTRLLLLFFCSSAFLCACRQAKYPRPLSPEEALQQFKLEDGFDITLFAAEPFVKDPVDMVFDEKGDVYVVEMPDYPSELTPGKPSGSIRFLEDENGDGRVDKVTVFADSLSEATSIMPWKGGLLVIAAPYILFLKDTSGDHRADIREVLFSGFFKENSEAQITSLRWGPDNWIYANNRGQHGMITYSRKTGEPLSVKGADFRFRLDRDAFEPETGPGQFGQTLDATGHRYFTENTLHIQQAVVPWRYLHRHPYLESVQPIVNISDHDPLMFQASTPPYWRVERTRRRNEQYRQNNTGETEYAAGHFTGASGGTIYMADLFPSSFYGNIFTGDVAGNLVHRDVIVQPENSVVHIAKRAATEKQAEFLSTTDSWFRPVNLHVGPDGSLYVIDMYRQHIETPLSIPEDLQEDMDFFAGTDMGRIYRIRPKQHATAGKASTRLQTAAVGELVANLEQKNQWLAIQSHRLLLEKKDAAAVVALRRMLVTGQTAEGKIRALSLLEGLDQLTAADVKTAMQDAAPAVKRAAMVLAEKMPEMANSIAAACNDDNAEVALQATLSLGNMHTPSIIPTFMQVLSRRGDDSWFRLAVLSSEEGSSPAMIVALAASSAVPAAAKASFMEEAGFVTGAKNDRLEVARVNGFLADGKVAVDESIVKAFRRGFERGIEKNKNQQHR